MGKFLAEVTDNREVFGESEGKGGNLKYFCDFVFLSLLIEDVVLRAGMPYGRFLNLSVGSSVPILIVISGH